METNNEPKAQSQTEQIKELVRRLAEHQAALGLSNSAFAGRYRQWLNSESSWLRLRSGNWDETLNADRWSRKLADLIQRLESGRSFDADSFKPLPPEDRYWQWEQELNEYVRQQQPERNGQG